MQHYWQVGVSTTAKINLPINVLKRGPITNFSIKHPLHSNFYNFFDAEKTIDEFLDAVKQKFILTDNVEVQGSVYLVNYQNVQSNVIFVLEDKRILLIDVYRRVFNQFIKQKIKEDFMRRVRVNGLTGSSWRFKRFNSLTISTKKDQKMSKGINFQAEIDDGSGHLALHFVENKEVKKFIDDSQKKPGTSLNFYRRFHNQSCEICDALNYKNDNNCKLNTRNLQLETYCKIDRNFIEFKKFDSYEKNVEKFKKSLLLTWY